MRLLALLALMAGAAGAGVGSAGERTAQTAPHPQSLCQSGESVLYSCPFARGTGSVCMGGGHLHYRFGRPGHVDLDIVNAPDWSNVHVEKTTGATRGAYEEHIRFTSGLTHYVVYADQAGNSWKHPGALSSGIAVFQGGKAVASLACRQSLRSGQPWLLDEVKSLHPGPAEEGDDGPFEGFYGG